MPPALPPLKIKKAEKMTPKARRMRSSPHERTISIDELFAAAFSKSKFSYLKESLLGWRPISHDWNLQEINDLYRTSFEEASSFKNSSDISIHETSEAFLIEVKLPEINEESLYLEISGDLLIIKAEKADVTADDSEKTRQNDPPLVHRYVKLPVSAQPGHVQARLESNLLKVILHKPWTGLENE